MCIHSIYTSLWEDAVLGEFDTFGSRVFVHSPCEQIPVKDVKLLPAVAIYSPAHCPHHSEQEQALQPHRHLLTGYRLHPLLTLCCNLIYTHTHTQGQLWCVSLKHTLYI